MPLVVHGERRIRHPQEERERLVFDGRGERKKNK